MLRLSTVLNVAKKTRFDLLTNKSSNIELEAGKYKFALINTYSIPQDYKSKIKPLLKQGFFVLFVSPSIPVNPIIHNNIVYIEAKARFMGITTFRREEYKKFNFVYGLDNGGKTEAKRISDFYRIPLRLELTNLPNNNITTIEGKEKLNILFDTNHEASGRGLGDILMSTAIIKQIRRNYPEANITYSTRPEGYYILLNNPNIDRIEAKNYNRTEFEKELDKYDKYYFLGKLTEDYKVERNRQPRVDSMAELFGLQLSSKKPELFLTEDEKIIGRKYIKQGKKNIVFCIEGIEKYRNWREDYLKETLKALHNKNNNLIVVGKKKIKLPNYVTNLTNKTSMRELFSIIYNSNLVVTMDNFVSHIAAAFEIPSIIMYTTIPAEWRSKYYKQATAIQSPVKCSPCWNLYKYNPRICKFNGKCIDELTPKLILKEIKKKLAEKQSIEKIFKELNFKTHSLDKFNNSKVIFISLWRRLGDCLFAIPTIKRIREIYPKHRIIWGTHYKYYDIVKNLPYIDNYVLFQGKVDEGWDAYLPSADGQIFELLNRLKPEKIFNLHISPKYSKDLTRKKHNIIEYVAYELAGLDKINTTLEYFPNKNIEKKVKNDFKNFRKGHKGIITYNGRCFSIAGDGMYKESELDYTLTLFEKNGYKVINIGNIVEDIDIKRENYHFSSLDYLYYAIKYSDLFIGYDSGIRNIALTVKGSKIISLENERSEMNKTKIEMLSKNKNHIGCDIKLDTPLDIYLKGMSLLENKEVLIKEYKDILDFQFVRKKESLKQARKQQKLERGI